MTALFRWAASSNARVSEWGRARAATARRLSLTCLRSALENQLANSHFLRRAHR